MAEDKDIGRGESWFANIKRTYDEFQDISLRDARAQRDHAVNVQNVALQALQNAVETANLVGKQAVRHGDVAIDRQWNLEPSQGAAEDAVLSNATAQNSIEAIVTAAVAAALAAAASAE